MKIKNNYIPLPYNIEKQIYKLATNNLFPFATLTSKQKTLFNKQYIRNPEYKHYHINKNMIENIKKGYIREHVIFNHHKIMNTLPKIREKYKYKDILELSTKYNFPPVTLLKLILNLDTKTFHKILDKQQKLNKRDQENLDFAIEHDSFSIVDEEKQLEESLHFEKQIEQILKENNIEYKTQEELAKEQIKKFGQAVNTPDFLLLTPIESLNNSKWIDAKNFYGANTKFNYKKIKKQTEKYIEEYGNGCIIFKYGYCKELADKFKNIEFYSFDQII